MRPASFSQRSFRCPGQGRSEPREQKHAPWKALRQQGSNRSGCLEGSSALQAIGRGILSHSGEGSGRWIPGAEVLVEGEDGVGQGNPAIIVEIAAVGAGRGFDPLEEIAEEVDCIGEVDLAAGIGIPAKEGSGEGVGELDPQQFRDCLLYTSPSPRD